MVGGRLIFFIVGIALVTLGYAYIHDAGHAPASPDIIRIPVEEGKTVPYSAGNWLSGIKYDRDGTILAHYHKPGAREDSFTGKYHVGQTFVFDCNVGDDSTLLSFYQYRGTDTSGDPQIVLARFDVDTESVPCEFPDVLFGDSYDASRIEFDPDFPYLSDEDAKTRHEYDAYTAPIQNAVALSEPVIEMPPAVPLDAEINVFSPWKNMVPADRHPGWINGLGHDPEGGLITVVYGNPYLPWNDFAQEYRQNQTFVYGCYDHVEPTLLYIYQYRGTQMVNGTLRLILAGIEAYTQEPTPCTSELIRASTDAYAPGRFDAQDPGSRDHPPLPDKEEILVHQKYIAPLPDEPPTLRADSILTSLLGSVSYQNTVIAGLEYHPEDDTITVEYDGSRLDGPHSQNYTPGQTYVSDCREVGPFTEIIFRRYLGTKVSGGDRYLAYADFTVNTKFPISCSDPGFMVNVADVYGVHWPDAHEDWASGIKKPERADYADVARADLVFEPRAIEPPVDPPEGAYDGIYNTFGYTGAEHNPGDDSVTLTYENLYVEVAVWGGCGKPATGLTHTQTYHANQTFAYCCRNLEDGTHMSLYQYRGTNLFQGERSFVFVHFEVEVPGHLQCRFPDYLTHTVDVYDAGNFDDLYYLHIYGGSPEGAAYNYTTYIEPIRYPVITSPIGVATWPTSVPYGEPTLLQYAKEAVYNPDGSLTVTHQYWDPEERGIAPGTDYMRTYAPGQTFLAYCGSYEDTTYLKFYSYRGTEVIRGEERVVLYYFNAHTRTPTPCPYPDYLDYADVFDASGLDRQYHLDWYGE